MNAVKVLLIVMLLGSVACAQQRRPRGPELEGERPMLPGPRGDRPWSADGPRGEGFRDGRYGPWEEITEEEWREAAALMQAHSPNRWQFFSELEEGDRFYRALRRRIVDQYRLLERIEAKDPDLLELKIRQIEVEDDVYGLIRTLGRAEEAEQEMPAGDDIPVPEEVRVKLQELVELQFAERRYHVERLEEALESEKARLVLDQGNMDGLVEQQWMRWRRVLSGGPQRRRPHMEGREPHEED
jgi:hypothetical protein